MNRWPLVACGMALVSTSATLASGTQPRTSRAPAGDCVTTGTPPPATTYTYRTVQGRTVSTMNYRWPEVSSGGSRLEVTTVLPARGQNRVVTDTSHRFENDLVLVDSYTTTGTNAAGPFTTRTVHRPALINGPALHICRGQTWRSGPVQVTTTIRPGATTSDRVSISGEVVALHDRVSVEAGTFDTVHFRQTQSSSHGSVVVNVWRSIDEGVTVKMDSTAAGATVVQTLVSRR